MAEKEYIEREAVLKCVAEDGHDCELDLGYWDHNVAFQEIIKEIPAADVRPVVRGKWEVGGMFDDIGRCSCCHYMFPLDTAMTEFHYCPNCGADMRERSRENESFSNI